MSNNAKKNTLKHPENTNKTCFEKFLKIRFSAQKCGSQHRFRTMLKYLEIPRKHQLNMFWGFLRVLENPVLDSKIRFSAQMSNNAKNILKHQLNTLWCILRNFWKSDYWLKIRFSAHMSNNAKIPWNTQKTPAKHVLRLFEKFLKIRFSAEKSGSRLRFRTMLKYLETLRKHQLNTFWGF